MSKKGAAANELRMGFAVLNSYDAFSTDRVGRRQTHEQEESDSERIANGLCRAEQLSSEDRCLRSRRQKQIRAIAKR